MLNKVWLLLPLLLLLISCDDDNNKNISSKITYQSSCKSSTALYKGTPSNLTAVVYSYNGSNQLILTHINAGFNCCPGVINSQSQLDGSKIIITENESQQGCHCSCLYDITIQVDNVSPGYYTIKINEPYAEQGPPIEFDANLNYAILDTLYFERNYYPWGA